MHFIQIVFVHLTVTFASSAKLAGFQRQVDLNDLSCAADEELFSHDLTSGIQCAFACLISDKCYSMFYGASDGKCYGCNTVYNASFQSVLPSVVGNVHYQIYPPCEQGWTGYMRSCYKLSSHAWFQVGAAECVSEGGHAVYIESAVENEFLKEYAMSDSSTWAWYIGIRDCGVQHDGTTDCDVQGEWIYYGTNELVQFTDFKVSDVTSARCALFFQGYDYQWARFECQHPDYGFPTICEINVL